nr:unnamed protein product [Callosobruchus chinensis]
MAAKSIELRNAESSHSSLISVSLIEQLQGKGNTNHNQLLTIEKASKLERGQCNIKYIAFTSKALQKEGIQDNPINTSNGVTLKEDDLKVNRVGFQSPQETGQVSGLSDSIHDISQDQNGQEPVDIEVPQELDKEKQHIGILKHEGSQLNQDINASGKDQKSPDTQETSGGAKEDPSILKQEDSKANHSINQNLPIDQNCNSKEADSESLNNIETMDTAQTKASYSQFEADNDLPVKEDDRMASNARNEGLGVASTRSFSASLHEETGGGSRRASRNSQLRNSVSNNGSLDAASARGYSSGNFDEKLSRRSSRNSQLRSSMENVIDDDHGYRRYSNQENLDCYDDCYGSCRNKDIQTGPTPILKHHHSFLSERSPFMRVVSNQTTDAPTSGYSVHNIPCDCQKVILTSNKKLQTSETNLTGKNVRYYCTNSNRQSSSQTVGLQDTRGDTNIRLHFLLLLHFKEKLVLKFQSQDRKLRPECGCCPETRKKSTNEAGLTEYNQPPSGFLENKCERVETYSNGVDRCCPTHRSRAVYNQQEDYQQPHMESGGPRYCVQGSYSNESESPKYCQPCPGYNMSKRSFLYSTRFTPSEFEDMDQSIPPRSPRRRKKRYPHLEYRRMSPLEPPHWRSPEYRKPKTKCTCNNCCCRGETAPPPPPLPEFFSGPDEEEEDIYNEASDISDDDCFCDDLGSPTGLSYQDNEEYQELLTERPIIDYDDTSGSEEPLIEKLSQLRSSRKAVRRRNRPAPGGRGKIREENEYLNEEQSTPCSSGRQFRPGLKREGSKSKWKLDEAGEWYKSPRTLKRNPGSSSPRKNYPNDICGCCACKACDRMK